MRSAEERGIGVLTDPLLLKQAGQAVPLLALVNERCGSNDGCRIKYAEEAKKLNVSTATLKAWAGALETQGYFTRKPRGSAGVEIQLCMDAWPESESGSTHTKTLMEIVDTLEALRLTIDRALDSAITDVRRLQGTAA